MAFNGRDLRSCQDIEEGSCFNIIPAIKRSRLIFRPESNFACVFKTKGHTSNIHSKSQWMSMANPVTVLKRLIPGLFWHVPQLTENAENAF
jgi:hypothetical protein